MSAAREEIKNKVTQWKNLFKDEIQKSTGIEIAENATDLTYAQLFNKAENTNFNIFDISHIVSTSIGTIGGFGQDAKALLNTTGYQEAKMVAQNIHQSFNNNQYQSLMSAHGALTTYSQLQEGKQIGAVLHYPSYPLLEMYFETDDVEEIELPDIFVVTRTQLLTVKGIRSLEENPVLKKALDDLKNV